MVNAFRCTCGKRCFRPRSISQYQSSVSSGCSPPTMWNSVTASLQPSPARLPDLLQRHRVRLGIFGLLAESAQPATGDANVGRIDVAVDVEVGACRRAAARAPGSPCSRAPECRGCGTARGRPRNDSRSPASTFSQDRLQAGIFNDELHRSGPGCRKISAAQNKKNSTLT